MNPLGAIRQNVSENPLVLLRLKRGSAYTWENLMILLALIVLFAVWGVRFAAWVACWRWVSALPESLQMREKRILGLASFENMIDSLEYRGPGSLEYQLIPFQTYAILLILSLSALAVLVAALRLFTRQEPLLPEDHLCLPITKEQLILARVDWRMLKYGLVLAFGLLFYRILPARPIGLARRELMPDFLDTWIFAWSLMGEFGTMFASRAASVWVGLFFMHRFFALVRVAPRGWSIRMATALILWSLASCISPLWQRGDVLYFPHGQNAIFIMGHLLLILCCLPLPKELLLDPSDRASRRSTPIAPKA